MNKVQPLRQVNFLECFYTACVSYFTLKNKNYSIIHLINLQLLVALNLLKQYAINLQATFSLQKSIKH